MVVPHLGPGLRAEQRAEEALYGWDRVGALKPGRRIAVRPFKGMGSKVAGDYVSSDDAGLVRRLFLVPLPAFLPVAPHQLHADPIHPLDVVGIPAPVFVEQSQQGGYGDTTRWTGRML